MATTNWTVLPRDGLFFKDGRGWYTGGAQRGYSLDWPAPPTVLGAARTLWGRGAELLDPNLLLDETSWPDQTASINLDLLLPLRRPAGQPWAPAHRMWPAPADALAQEGRATYRFLDPRRPTIPTLGLQEDPAREALWRPWVTDPGKPLRAPRWWPEADWLAWLLGQPVPLHDSELRRRQLELPHRLQVHVGLEPNTLTARDGILFAEDVLETLTARWEQSAPDEPWNRCGCWEWSLGVRLTHPELTVPANGAAYRPDWATLPWTLGGERRLAHGDPLPAHFFDPPAELLRSEEPSAGIRLLLVTPAHFQAGWLPPGLTVQAGTWVGQLPGCAEEVVLRAAYVPRAVPISGWDLVRRAPKPTRRLVPAGAVYFFTKRSGATFTSAEFQALWLSAWGLDTHEGLGRFVPGRWNPDTTPAPAGRGPEDCDA